MRPLSLIVTLPALAAALPQAGQGAEKTLASLKWKARPVVVLSDRRDDPRIAKQLSSLDAAKPALAERDIQLLEETEPDGALHRQLGAAKRGFSVVLVGKDGGVKRVWRDLVDPRRIFEAIDQMPMRREEMKG